VNFVFISPHFPSNYYQFCTRLSNLGVNVLGLADEPYDYLRSDLRQSLREYFRVSNMHNYDEMIRAMGYFIHRYGKINRLDSLSEYWLEAEAQLRTDFNIPGIRNDEIARIKRKSLMKQTFVKAGINVARGKVVRSINEARKLINETGFPVVAKPDIGVGAAKTYKIHSQSELEEFFLTKPLVDYIMEEFVDGVILTFDGLTDRDGNAVFYSSLQYSQGIMETVLNDDLIYYYTLREIPNDLEEAGMKTLKAFNVRERFFHFEFFRRAHDQQIVALEVNMRPPGGLTTDMFNFANDIDIYAEWANIIVNNQFNANYTRPYHCCYVGRKFNRRYHYTQEEIELMLGPCLVHHEQINGIFSAALGDYGYLLRSPVLEEVKHMAELVIEQA
jgi:hypothetical protein